MKRKDRLVPRPVEMMDKKSVEKVEGHFICGQEIEVLEKTKHQHRGSEGPLAH